MRARNSPLITAIVLTKNEEKNIGSCLSHLKWLDEIVILDSGSTDRTCKIALNFGARVESRICEPFKVAEQRNFAIEELGVESEWILFIDADEIATEPFAQAVLESINSAPQEVLGFHICPKFMFLGKWLKYTSQFPAWHDRLFRRDKVRFTGVLGIGPWERFEKNEDGIIGEIHEPYLHFGFSRGFAAWFERHNNYSTWAAQEIWHELNSLAWREILIFLQDPTTHRKALRAISAKFLWASPLLHFFYTLIYRRGFLDGFPGLIYSLMLSTYQFMIYLKVKELHFQEKGLSV